MPADGIPPVTGVRTLGVKCTALLAQLEEAVNKQQGLRDTVSELEAVLTALKSVVETSVIRTDEIAKQAEELSTRVSEQSTLLETTISRVDVLES